MCLKNMFRQELKYRALNILVELMTHANFITAALIKKFKYVEAFKTIMKEKRPKDKKIGLDLINVCLKEISKRASNIQII